MRRQRPGRPCKVHGSNTFPPIKPKRSKYPLRRPLGWVWRVQVPFEEVLGSLGKDYQGHPAEVGSDPAGHDAITDHHVVKHPVSPDVSFPTSGGSVRMSSGSSSPFNPMAFSSTIERLSWWGNVKILSKTKGSLVKTIKTMVVCIL